MAHATMTLIGLYNYDNNLFDLLTLPATLDKDTLVDNLLLRSGQFEVLYPDPDFMKFSIGAWSRKWQATFQRWVDALAIEYDPLENYDRREEWTDKRHGASAENRTTNGKTHGMSSDSSSETTSENSLGKTHGATSGSTNSTTTHNVSAYDSATLQPSYDDVTAGLDGSHTATAMDNTVNGSKTGTGTSHNASVMQNSDDIKSHNAEDALHQGRVHGNIGTLTSQTMLMSELDLGYWNIYEKIIDIFLTEFVIPIY